MVEKIEFNKCGTTLLLICFLIVNIMTFVTLFSSAFLLANATTIPSFTYSNYSGYTIVQKFEYNVGTAEPKYIVFYKSNAGIKYVRNKYLGNSMYHTKGRTTTLE
ncbi:MAG: hypothetical protein LBF68_07885 [Christensenellaceae bacterium]|nr:hypothetical protein [Christensenellaceae bacterium]